MANEMRVYDGTSWKLISAGAITNEEEDLTFTAEDIKALADNKVDKVSGKQLSTNDYTTVEKNEVAKVKDKVDKVDGQGLSTNDYSNADKDEVAKIKNKVDKVSGKQLSTNDYTTVEKNEVAKVKDKANQSDLSSHTMSTSNPHKVDKTQIELSNVDNIKQMPISGGVLENYREQLTTVSPSGGTINLNLGNVFQHTPSGKITYSIINAVNNQAHSFTLIIKMGATVRTISFPSSIKWQGGDIPDLTTANKTYVLTFLSTNGGTLWLGMFGGEF